MMANQTMFGNVLHNIIDQNVGDIIHTGDGNLRQRQFNCWYSSLYGPKDWDSWNHLTGEEFPDDIYLYLGQHDMTRYLLSNDIDYLSNKILRVYIRIVRENYTNIRNEPLIEEWKMMLYNEIFDEFRDKVINDEN